MAVAVVTSNPMAPQQQRKPPTKGIVQGETPGFYPGPKLLTFTPGRISHFASLFRDRDLTVCSHLKGLVFHFVMLAYACTVMAIFSREVFWPDGPGCGAGKNTEMCQLNDILMQAKSEFRFLIAFILAGFVARSVGMWERRRTNYAALCGCARNLNVQVGALLPTRGHGDGGDEALDVTRARLGRYIMLAYELAVLKGRGKIDSEEAREYLSREGLLEPGEWERMVAGDRHTTVWFWLQFRIARLADEGILTEQRLTTLSSSITASRAQANDLMSSLDRDAPFPCECRNRSFSTHTSCVRSKRRWAG
jgi:hypothetical protein